MLSRRVQWAAAVGLFAGAAALASFGPLVRYEAAKTAERYGASVEIEHVVPTWRGAKLEGVRATVSDVPAATVELGEVEVAYGLDGRRVALRNGLVRLVGPRPEVARQVEAWRAKRSGGGASSGGGRSDVDLESVNVAWQDASEAPTEAMSATAVHLSRSESKLEIGAATASLQLGRGSVLVTNGLVKLERRDGGYHLAGLEADAIEAAVDLSAGALSASEKDGARDESAAEPRPRSKGAELRDALLRAANQLDHALEPGASIRLHGVRAKLKHRGDTLGVGPGTFTVTRSDDAMIVELAPDVATGKDEQALTFRANVPLGAAAASKPLALDVQGGPIWLSTLGLHDGDFGLFDVGRASLAANAHLTLAPDATTMTLSGDGTIHALSLRSAALSDEPVAGLELAWRGKATAALDGSRVEVDGGELDLGSIRLLASGVFEREEKDAFRVRGTFELPLTGCQQMFDSAPNGMKSKLVGMRFAGTFALKGKTSFDTRNLDRLYDLTWDTSNTCRVVEAPPEINVERFRFPFKHWAYDADGNRIEVESGPGSQGWMPIDNISHFMPVALLSTEDGGFLHHHGFDAEAIKNSIRENLRKRKFVRGASTLSMQLAKNLYLDRTKSLARKLQEAVLTMYLEQELTKMQILELYLNAVEFAPNVYGIGPAAYHYFNTPASELTLGQSLYIASILPNPKVQHFGAGGAVTDSWMAYLRKLMRQANKRQRVSDEELEEGLRETVVRGQPKPLMSAKPPGGTEPDEPTMESPDVVF